MEIVLHKKINNDEYGINTNCEIHYLHIRLLEPTQALEEFLTSISETSWLSQLNIATQKAFRARAMRTVSAILTRIRAHIEDGITKESGEYLISYAANIGLSRQCEHKSIPLAELWKEKVLGNPGFDFHTESPANVVIFGESKYSSTFTPHMNAINQIMRFIKEEKDIAELNDLKNFIRQESERNLLDGKKGFAAAFSVNARDIKHAIIYPLQNAMQLGELFEQAEVYLIGVEM